MANGESILLRLQTEGHDVPQVTLPPAVGGDGELSVRDVALRESGRFQVLGELAAGGVGQILKGRDIDLGRDVALKVIHEKHLGNENVLQRFVEEAQIGGQLQHPGIVPVYELGLQADKRPFFAMKLVKGRTFAAMLTERESPSEDRRRFLQVFEEVCQTVGYAHARGVIHRDLKPANVMVGAFGEVQVLDWGFAKVLPRGGIADERASRTKAPPVTEIATVRTIGEGSESIPGSVMGTLAYMPPEQALGQVDALDERSDAFSLGAILCEILTGEPPYTGQGKDLLIQAVHCDLTDAHARLDGCDAHTALVELAKQCLSPLSRDRPRSASALAEVVHDHLAQAEERARTSALEAAAARAETERADQEAKDQRRVRRLGLACAGAVVVAIVLGGGSWLWMQGNRRARAERARGAVTTAMAEAQKRRGEERWSEALVAATQAADLAASPDVDVATRERARTLQTVVRQEEETARAATAQQAKDRAFLAKLEAIRLDRTDRLGDPRRTDDAYAEAFRAYGVDVIALEPAAAGARLRERGVAFSREAAAALDGWASLRTIKPSLADRDAELLLSVADACDPDPSLRRLRGLVRERDADGLAKLAREEAALELPIRSLVQLGGALQAEDRDEVAVELLSQAALRHPGAYGLHVQLAWSLKTLGRGDDSLRHYTAALAIRPKNALVYGNLGALYCDLLKDLDAAEHAFRAAIGIAPDNASAWFGLGNTLNAQERYEGAVEAYRESLRIDPGSGGTHNNMANALKRLGRFDEALAAYREGIRVQPGLVSLHQNLVRTLGVQGDLDSARLDLDKALHLHPESAKLRIALANVLTERGLHEEAAELLRQAIRYEPENVAAHSNLGVALYRLERFEEAVASLQEAVRLDPESSNAYTNLGAALDRMGRHEEDLAAQRRAVELDPESAAAHYNVGTSLLRAQRPADAVRAFREALRLQADAPSAWRMLGHALHQLKNYEEALAAFEEAIRLQPTEPTAHHMRGNTLAALGQDEKALGAYGEALRLNPKDILTRFNKGNALRALARHDEATAAYRAFLDVHPAFAPAHGNLGLSLYALGRVEEAIESLQAARRLQPTNANHSNNLAAVLCHVGRHEEAVDLCREAIRLEPEYPGAFTNLGNALKALGKLDEAIEAYRGALAVDPEWPEAWFNLGNTLLETGDLDGAIEAYRKAARLAPSRADASAAYNLGTTLFNAGRYEDALEAFELALAQNPDHALAWCNRGRTLFALGRYEEALPFLRRGHAIGSKQPGWPYPSADWIDQCERLGALHDRLLAVLAGEDEPATPIEALGFAEMSQLVRRDHLQAAQLYQRAFTGEPALAEHLASRYNAACCAALLGTGKSASAEDLDDAKRSMWREQARTWLERDLAWKVETQPEGILVHLLKQWLHDPDFAGVRTQAALAELPAEEREAWRTLWAEVDSARERAEEARGPVPPTIRK